jgi:hypothetical protein
MNGVEVIRQGYRDVQGVLRSTIDEIDDETYWWQPGPLLNHPGFLAWHVVRDEDTVVSYVCKQPERWSAEGWDTRFSMDSKEQGTGLDPERIETFRYDRALFRAYAESVWRRTPELLATLDDGDLDGQAWPGSDWTVATQLVEGSIGHAWMHLGEIHTIRGLRGWRSPE